jgi:hypothetical protein
MARVQHATDCGWVVCSSSVRFTQNVEYLPLLKPDWSVINDIEDAGACGDATTNKASHW